jgi:hypothetical protein
MQRETEQNDNGNGNSGGKKHGQLSLTTTLIPEEKPRPSKIQTQKVFGEVPNTSILSNGYTWLDKHIRKLN